MGKKVFLGYVRDGGEERYRVIDSETFKYCDYTLRDLRVHLKDVVNVHINMGEVIPEDGLVYGVKSVHPNECMNTYTVIGKSMGCYVICDFNKTEIMALHEYELYLNKELFIRQQLTNAIIRPWMGETKRSGIDVMVYNVSFIDNVSKYVYSGKENRLVALRYMRRLYRLRLKTMESGQYKLEKFNGYNLRLVQSNIDEIDAILDSTDKQSRLDLQRLMRLENVDKPMIDNYYINRYVYMEE